MTSTSVTTVTLQTARGTRTYTGSRRADGAWVLAGARGASYWTEPVSAQRPEWLRLCSLTAVDPLGPVVLVERDGQLTQVLTADGVVLTQGGHAVVV